MEVITKKKRTNSTEYNREYYLKNRARYYEKVQCECGCMIRRSNLFAHRQKNKHFNLMKQIRTNYLDENY